MCYKTDIFLLMSNNFTEKNMSRWNRCFSKFSSYRLFYIFFNLQDSSFFLCYHLPQGSTKPRRQLASAGRTSLQHPGIVDPSSPLNNNKQWPMGDEGLATCQSARVGGWPVLMSSLGQLEKVARTVGGVLFVVKSPGMGGASGVCSPLAQFFSPIRR